MSGITSIRSFFRTQMNALDYREWTDGFNFANIPSTILNNSYHLETIAGARRGDFDPQSQELLQDITVRVFLKGYRNPADAIDSAMTKYDAILARVMDPTRRLTQSFCNIYLQTMAIRPLSDSNDNAVILEINFSCLIIIET